MNIWPEQKLEVLDSVGAHVRMLQLENSKLLKEVYDIASDRMDWYSKCVVATQELNDLRKQLGPAMLKKCT